MAFIEPMHRNKPNITYLLTYYYMILHISLQWVRQNINHDLNTQKTAHHDIAHITAVTEAEYQS